MKLVVLYGEPPVPALHGGRVDVYRRLLALKDAGVEVFLVSWCNPDFGERPQKVAEDAAGLAAKVRVFTYGPFMRRPWLLARYPGWIAARVLGRQDLQRLVEEVREFQPDGILIDGLPCAAAGLQLAQALGAPYLFRSHNREYDYIKAQAGLVRDWRGRLRFLANLPLLKGFEEKVLRGANAFYDISASDLAAWQAEGLAHGTWLPPVLDPAYAARLSAPGGWAPRFDVGYLGNLVNANNVQGVLWFVREVVPRLRAKRPDIGVLIAGSKPLPEVVEACAEAGVTLLPNPEDATAVFRDAKVLVNPVFQGSGVNLKSVEMLHTPAGLVATSIGVGGMPENATAHFAIADDPHAFAEAVLAKIDRHAARPNADKSRVAARAAFSPLAIAPLIERIGGKGPARDA